MSRTITKTIKLTLPCILTEDELKEKAKELSNGIQEESRLKDEKKFLMKQAAAKIDNVATNNTQLAGEIGRETEYRDVMVKRIFDYTEGKVTEVRTDTGEVIETRELSDEEKQVPLIDDEEDPSLIGEVESKPEMYDEAIKIVQAEGKASTSLLQRKLKIGYGSASRFIDRMEEEGFIGPADGSKPREVL